MKNMRVQFEAADGSELRISLSRGKQALKTQVRHRDAQEGRARIGCKNWFELTEEDKAQASFDELVRDAEAHGWTWVQKTRTPKMAFTAIPDAPTLPLSGDHLVGELKSTLKSVRKSAKK